MNITKAKRIIREQNIKDFRRGLPVVCDIHGSHLNWQVLKKDYVDYRIICKMCYIDKYKSKPVKVISLPNQAEMIERYKNGFAVFCHNHGEHRDFIIETRKKHNYKMKKIECLRCRGSVKDYE